ncbi:DUF2100 domain-containing protein [Methanothermococcus okinawensis]|uniref:DUF2100 domain-containing protein n=1 Tax=Methanothermococcus okinawensis (strain DSM 14208 / JCM 11175 / IH1) TaxID=647113 RepID=F8AMM9_METOI|nr:DUF2100 domain-containing protein [Methanothermococcus okinawensis]AEH06071.1 Protein of unknown function DUF2100 [Methanothermococcus okinawensis IH1]
MNRLNDSKILIKKAVNTIDKLDYELKLKNNTKTKTISESKSISYKDAKSGTINVDEFKKAVYAIIEADDYLYKKAPLHNLNDDEAKMFCKLVFQTQKHLNNVLKAFGFEFEEGAQLDESALYIVSNKKLLKNLKNKMPNLNIISTEGILEAEDMKVINPNMPEGALKGIEKKCNITKEQITKLINKLNPSKVIVIVDDSNKADELIYIRAKELYGAEKISIDDIDL